MSSSLLPPLIPLRTSFPIPGNMKQGVCVCREEFDNLTDWSSMLLKYGDYHAHTDTREEMEKRMGAGGSQPEAATGSPTAEAQPAAAGANAASDDDEVSSPSAHPVRSARIFYLNASAYLSI